jgi:hypothetical protein
VSHPTDTRPTGNTVTKEASRVALLKKCISAFNLAPGQTVADQPVQGRPPRPPQAGDRGQLPPSAASTCGRSDRPRPGRTAGGGTRRVPGGRSVVRLALISALASSAFLLVAGPASAAPSPWWHLSQRHIPTDLKPEGEGTIVVNATNLGDAPVASGPITFTDTLPAGVILQKAEFFVSSFFINPQAAGPRFDLGPSGIFGLPFCQTTANSVSCTLPPSSFEAEELFVKPLVPYSGELELRLAVKTLPGAVSGGLNETTASGGTTPPAAARRALTIGDDPVRFGVEEFALRPEEEGGETATRAGSHPFQLTNTVTFNRNSSNPLTPPALPRNLHFRLPAGQLGNPTALPQCSDLDFATILEGGQANLCPADTALGATAVTISTFGEEQTLTVPVFNLIPATGEPARFGFEVLANPVILDTEVRSGPGPGGEAPDYGVNVNVSNITQLIGFISATTTFWGAPADVSHNESRGWGCIAGGRYAKEAGQVCTPSAEAKPDPFLTMPTNCAAPYVPALDGASWPTQDAPDGFTFPAIPYQLQSGGGNSLPVGACNQVPFSPQIKAEPTSDAATSPTGLNFDINVDDEGLRNSEGLAQSQLKKAVVTLPQGFTTNPSVAEGLKACSFAEYESTTVESGGCNQESKIGNVEIESPLVEQKVLGSLYVAQQKQNPNNNLLTIYLVARNSELGILIKQALRITPDPLTGQLTTEVDNVPELPFNHFHLEFRQGQRSPLITPPACGNYTIEAALYPWSNPTEPVHDESSFQITQGPEGLGCPSGGLPPFHPHLEAGSENPTAGAYSPFYTDISRKDSEQEITRFSIKLPTGMLAKLKGVSECSDAQVAAAKAREHEGGGAEEEAAPSCPANSLVGHSDVGTGVGTVLAYAPGKLYLAGPYHGSPISLVSITAAKVGPFDLGTVVVRFALDVNHETAEVSVDGANSDPIPHIIDGIPVHLRDIQATVDRPGFTLNPTSCAKKSTASTILGSGLNFASSSDDVPVTVSSPFQVGNCASLGFKPKLALNLVGKKTHRGALPAFKAVLTYPKGGSYANIAKAQVTLPGSEFLEQGHLKNVCTRKIFETGANPGENCPKNSIYGKARATTPLLDQPLEGPVYLRTGYGTRLPELAAALNGPQISITLAGTIDSVHQKGTEGSRIRNTFAVVPDAPVEKFTLELKGGKKGLLVNSTDVCKGTHKALAAFTGQNGKLDEYEPALKAQCGKSGGKKKGGKKKGKDR